jgi:CBS domain-containing protein
MIPVVDGDYLVGIVTFQNLMRKLTALSLRRTTPKTATANAPAPQP